MAEWDLREVMLIASWRAQGHAFRTMSGLGAVICLRCSTLINVRTRAQVAANGSYWGEGDPRIIKPCPNPTRVSRA